MKYDTGSIDCKEQESLNKVRLKYKKTRGTGVNMKLVSVIMPTYKNEMKELKRAIDSVLSQTYKNIELVIIDDNSELFYSKLIEQALLIYKNEKIVYIKNEKNLGSAKSRNIGIINSSGEYISFLDADDEYLPQKIKSQVELMIENNADYCLSNLNLFDDNNNLVRKRRHVYVKGNYNLLRLHLMYHLTGTDTMMFKKEYICKIGMFDEEDMGDEFYLMLKAIQSEGLFIFQDECFVKAYTHQIGKGLSAGNSKIVGDQTLFNYKKQFFSQLNRKDICFIKVRYYLSLSISYWKRHRYISFILNIMKSFVISPYYFAVFVNKKRKKEY